MYKKTITAAMRAPFFLVWKAVIDELSFTSLYRDNTWIRTQRHRASDDQEGNA
jgi:hypothetical protein